MSENTKLWTSLAFKHNIRYESVVFFFLWELYSSKYSILNFDLGLFCLNTILIFMGCQSPHSFSSVSPPRQTWLSTSPLHTAFSKRVPWRELQLWDEVCYGSPVAPRNHPVPSSCSWASPKQPLALAQGNLPIFSDIFKGLLFSLLPHWLTAVEQKQ